MVMVMVVVILQDAGRLEDVWQATKQVGGAQGEQAGDDLAALLVPLRRRRRSECKHECTSALDGKRAGH
jgi:hypothetical protein